jgi:predicted MFS family arabinose efflux permease
MGVYAVAMTIGFMVAFPTVQATAEAKGWRTAWAAVGIALIVGLAPLAWLLTRRTPEAMGLPIDGEPAPGVTTEDDETAGDTLGKALGGGAFWVFALAASIYGLAASGIGLFNESILAQLGFDSSLYRTTLVITALVGLLGNFVGGWLSQRASLRVLLVVSMLFLATVLGTLPHLRAPWHAYLNATAMGIAGGFVMVVFFAYWGQAYGRAHLGRIQGAAQILTVLCSALGPVVLARCVDWTGSYSAAFYALAATVGVLGIAGALVRLPARLVAATPA